jgi:hypothetical protein
LNAKTHWEKVYTDQSPEAVSWYCSHLETSLALIERVADERQTSIIDVGGGESTLVDDLLVRGYKNITVLDVSQIAIDLAKKRLGSAAEQVRWVVAISLKLSWNHVHTTSGMIARYSIFLPHTNDALLMSGRSPTASGQAAMSLSARLARKVLRNAAGSKSCAMKENPFTANLAHASA